MALEGPLKEFHIQDVFQLLDLGRKSGVLRVTSELRQTAGTVSFERGGVVAATLGRTPSRSAPGWSGWARSRRRSSARALALQHSGDSRRLGDILVANGAITRRELDRQLKAQIEEAIFELLGWSEGYFRFEDGAPLRGHGRGAGPDSDRGAADGSRPPQMDEWSRIEDKVPHLRVVPRLPASDAPRPGGSSLTPLEWEVLAAVDGQRDLHALAAALGRSEFDIARTVYALSSAGVIVLDSAPPQHRPAKTGVSPVLRSVRPGRPWRRESTRSRRAMLQEVLRSDPLMPEARRLFGVCQVALGRFRSAAETWRSWARLGTHTPAEEALIPAVDRLRQAAETLAEELESYRD